MKKPIKPSKFLTPFKQCVIQNFPFIEEDFDALTNYGLLCKIVEYLNKVIDSQTQVLENVENLSEAFNNLKAYVDNFFDNLDVQEEINNKLDEMAEDGTLQEIVASYLNSTAVWGFDTVEDMQAATNLINGSYVRTFGFNTINDGGGALYYITNSGTADGKTCIAVGELYANIVIPANNTLSIKQIGATTSDDIHDYVTYLISNNITCYIPKGVWKTSPIQISKYNTSRIIGEEVFLGNDNNEGTILTPITNQDYIIKVGYDVYTSTCNNVTIKNIQFNSNNFTLTHAVEIFRVEFSTFENISFNKCKCNDSALSIIEAWENEFGRIYFRTIDAPYALKFGNKLGSGNITANLFRYLSFEGCRYGCIHFGSNTGYSCNTIEVLDYESGAALFDDEERSILTNETVYTPYSIIELGNGYNDIVINTINVNNIANFAYTSSNGDYVRCTDRIFNGTATDTGYAAIVVDNVSGTGAFKTPILINATTLDKFYCRNLGFRSFQRFISNVEGCRIFQDNVNDTFRDNYITGNIDRSYRDLVITNNVASCKNKSGRAVRVASLVTKSDTLYVKGKGTGGVYLGASDHISWSDEDGWKSFAITSDIGSSNNLQITSASTDLEVTDYFFA